MRATEFFQDDEFTDPLWIFTAIPTLWRRFFRYNDIDLMASLMKKSEDSTFLNKVSGSYVIAHLCRLIRCYLCGVIGRSMGLFNSELDFQILRIENYKIEH